MKIILFSVITLFSIEWALASDPDYSPRGIGGGGALAGYSISPYSDLRFVGTDMGTLFRSVDKGQNWAPVRQTQVSYNSDLKLAADVGFSADPKVVFFADAGREPKRSTDGGLNWARISIPLVEDERILYWLGSSIDPKVIFCGTTEGLLRTTDQGYNWKRLSGASGNSKGTLLIPDEKKSILFHATETNILISHDAGESFSPWYTAAPNRIRAFTGGSDAKGLTLSFMDSQGEKACSWAKKARDSNQDQKDATINECGFIWVHKSLPHHLTDAPHFTETKKEGGRFLRMAENDSQTIYVTGGDWVRQYGSKIWISKDAGSSWSLIFQVYDWDQHPYQPWPKEKLEYSAAGLDNGWDDNAPFTFNINRRKSSEVGSAGHYFLHVSRDFGEHWLAPFTKFADTGERTKGKKWKSTGLEVTSNLKIKFNPLDPKLAYVSLADMGGQVTEDGGESFRISKAKYNTNYDYAFDPKKKDRVYAASGSRHDFPLNINTPIQAEGGIFVSDDRGKNWTRLTPESEVFNRQFLSVAFDSLNRILYGGTEGGGIARSTDEGHHWEWINSGFPEGDLVIPQLEVDPKNGTLYALMTGNAPEFKNVENTGIYRLHTGLAAHWELLRKTILRPKGIDENVPLWLFPSAFAIDFSRPERNVLYLTDIENKGAWLATGVWKSLNSGQNWARTTQFTHPTSISLDTTHPENVFVSGLYDVTGKWGQGGFLYSHDGGLQWKKSEKLPLLANLFSFTLDPTHPKNGFFLFFGGGMLYGPTTGPQ